MQPSTRRLRTTIAAVGLFAALLSGCASTGAQVTAGAATPVTNAPPGTTQPRPSGTVGQTPKTQQAPDTEQQPPDTQDLPLPSIEQQADAQALIDEVPKVVGDSDLHRKSTQIDEPLKAALQRIADGNAGGDDSFFALLYNTATDGQVVSPYLICPIADGDGCSASKADFEQYLATCVGDSTQWAAMLVPGSDGWAAAAVCLWKPTDAERIAAMDVVAKSIVADSGSGQAPLRRDPALDAAAKAWAAVFSDTRNPADLPAFSDITSIIADTASIQSPGEISNGDLADRSSGSWDSAISNGVSRFGLSTVVVNRALVVLIVAGA